MDEPLKVDMHADVSQNMIIKFKTEEGREQSQEARAWLTKVLGKESTLVKQVYTELKPIRKEKYPMMNEDDKRRAFLSSSPVQIVNETSIEEL